MIKSSILVLFIITSYTDFSNFRLRDSINTIEKIIDYAIELGHSCIAITEHETIASSFRALKHYKKIKESNPNFKVILGNEIYLCRNGLNSTNFNREQDRYYHFILLAKDAIGHEQIREISTRAWMRSYTTRGMVRVPTYYQDLFEIIGSNPGHVIGSTACLGSALGTQLLHFKETQDFGLLDRINKWCVQLRDLFGEDNFFLEMQPSKNLEQIYVNNKIVSLSKELGIPFIITNDAHYLRKKDAPIHKAFLNAQGGEREVDAFYATTYLMDTTEINSFMIDNIGEENVQKAFLNILKLQDSCEDFSLAKPLQIPSLEWKKILPINNKEKWIGEIPSLKTFLESNFKEDAHLANLLMNRLEIDTTLQNAQAYNEIGLCLNDIWESSTVNNVRWSAYLLNLQNIIDICWESNSLVGAGRGSGVGFLLLYMLDITQINPLREKSPTKRFRFLNPSRVSPLDIDIDIEGSKRQDILRNFRKKYGEDRVANVLTLGTEKSKSAILTAARGLGIDVDIAQYLSSMIVSDRGQIRTLKQTFYGDEENGISPDKKFQNEMTNNYPELWEVAQAIEGLICRVGCHAGGVIFVDESFTKSTALMRAPSGEIITQFDLHDAEATSLIKYDVLSVEALDKIHNCLELLVEHKMVEPEKTLKELYEKVVGVYNLERDNPKMWEMVWDQKIMSLFQMEKQSGIQGIAALKPTSVDDLAVLNSTIRLMAQEKGGEMPTQKLARFKADSREWDRELEQYGLGEKEKAILEPILGVSYGLCITQEQFMELVQLPELGGFSLEFADRLRKSIAKKNPKEYELITKEFFEEIQKRKCNFVFCRYVWMVLIAMSKGYGFNMSHTLAYSIIGLQEMNLAFRYPVIFWNCACLIADSGGCESEIEEDEEVEVIEECQQPSCLVEEFTDDDDEEDDDEVEETKKIVKRKNKHTTNFGKIATAIGQMRASGILIAPPDINKSSYTFNPDLENNAIRYGLSGITRVGEDLIQSIILNRPYSSLEDFRDKVKINKLQLINLIKSGAFDSFGDRTDIMRKYIEDISDVKKRVTLQNMKMLIDFNLIPVEYDMVKKVFNFNKYLKKFKTGIYYSMDNIAMSFFEKNFDIDLLTTDENSESGFVIKTTIWETIYQKHMDKIRPFVKSNSEQLLKAINDRLIEDSWNKYCLGSLSTWEMDSVSYYSHEHELAALNESKYGLSVYEELPEEPEIDRVIYIKGKPVPLFRIVRIAGTVLHRDKTKKTVTLLTKGSVVTVRIYGTVFAHFDKQISEVGADGKKHIIEKSQFSRGNKIIVTGIKKEDSFLAKKYSTTDFPLVELITNIDENGNIRTYHRE